MVANQELASDGHQVFQDPVVPKVGSDNKPSGHKSQKRRSRDADLGSDNEPKRSRSERSTVTLAGVQQEVKRREKKKKKSVRTAMKTVIEAADQADFKLKYEQHKQLGEGGYGAVFAGVRISDQQPVAIKYIHKPTVLFVPMEFKNKVHDVPAEVLLMALAAPNHEPIGRSPSVSLLEWFNLDNGHIVLVMERPTPSIDLFDYCLQNVPLPEEKAKEVMQQVVEALVDLHSKKVFHRDIKLENLLVQTTESGPRIRIIDFGCSCVVQSQTFQSEFIGTFDFAPPEYFQNNSYCPGPTSVWQTGALMYELLHSNDQSDFTTQNAMEGNISAPSGVSQECCDFLQACLTLNPEQRISLDQLSHHPWFKKNRRSEDGA